MIQPAWATSWKHVSAGVVDVVEELGEELSSVVLIVTGGVVALSAEDGDEGRAVDAFFAAD